MRITVNPITGKEEVILFKQELKWLKQAQHVLVSLSKHQPETTAYLDAATALGAVNHLWHQGEKLSPGVLSPISDEPGNPIE